MEGLNFEALLTAQGIISLFTLALLEIVLGIDNVIFVSIIMGRLQTTKQKTARKIWMITGIITRIILLFCLSWLISQKGKIIFTLPVLDKGFDLASIVMLLGGLFLLYKTVREIHHKLEGDEEARENSATKAAGAFGAAIFQIILVDMVFSFDSILTAVGIATQLAVMVVAVIIAMIVMFLFSQKIATFIQKHPTLKMLALSFLVMIALVLVMEGWDAETAHEMHLKNYVYFGMAFSVLVELMNMRVRKKSSKPVELHSPKLQEVSKDNTPLSKP